MDYQKMHNDLPVYPEGKLGNLITSSRNGPREAYIQYEDRLAYIAIGSSDHHEVQVESIGSSSKGQAYEVRFLYTGTENVDHMTSQQYYGIELESDEDAQKVHNIAFQSLSECRNPTKFSEGIAQFISEIKKDGIEVEELRGKIGLLKWRQRFTV